MFVALTLAITWPQGILREEDDLTAAAQVHGGVGQLMPDSYAKSSNPRSSRTTIFSICIALDPFTKTMSPG